MIPRLTTEQVAVAASRHVVTIRLALVSGELHGTQHVKGGRWLVREDCFEAWLDGEKCARAASRLGGGLASGRADQVGDRHRDS